MLFQLGGFDIWPCACPSQAPESRGNLASSSRHRSRSAFEFQSRLPWAQAILVAKPNGERTPGAPMLSREPRHEESAPCQQLFSLSLSPLSLHLGLVLMWRCLPRPQMKVKGQTKGRCKRMTWNQWCQMLGSVLPATGNRRDSIRHLGRLLPCHGLQECTPVCSTHPLLSKPFGPRTARGMARAQTVHLRDYSPMRLARSRGSSSCT